ncbi:MAG: DUF983 domain-containing protein [Anaerolineales bacterium]|nr:DUF983 domain-containing protein [Anaerolineales bacterium]
MLKRLWALLRLRCPHCLHGRTFVKPFRMGEDCAVCGIHFEREEGYWAMSMFVGYVMSLVIVLPLLAVLYMLHIPIGLFMLITAVALILITPIVFHYARIIWLYIDEAFDPRPEPIPVDY